MRKRQFRKVRRPSLARLAMLCEGIDDEEFDIPDDEMAFYDVPKDDWEAVKQHSSLRDIKKDIRGLEGEIDALLSSGDAEYTELDNMDYDIDMLKRKYKAIKRRVEQYFEGFEEL